MNKAFAGALCVLALTACGKQSQDSTASTAPQRPSGISLADFDDTVRPQDSLYLAVNGNWLARTAIPSDKSNYGSFTLLSDNANTELRGIIEELSTAPNKKPGSIEQKIGDHYAAFMDETRIEQLGVQPLQAQLTAIGSIQNAQDLPLLMARLARGNISVPLSPYVHLDPKNSTRYAGDFWQWGLGMPDRDYYIDADSKFAALRQKYLQHLNRMLTLAGIDSTGSGAQRIMALETRLAQAQWDKVDIRDAVKTYNPYTVPQLSTLAPQIDWPAYLEAVGYGGLDQILISQPSYVTALGKAFAEVPLDDWKLYFQWQTVNAYAPRLSSAFVDENFGFFQKTLNGIPENQPRWKRGVNMLETSMGEAIGQIYVQRYFPPENKARMEAMVKNLVVAYGQAIDTLDWMSEPTRKAAKLKLSKFQYKIGYPDQWRDYSKLEIVAGDLVGNAMRANIFEYDRNISKLGKPVDRGEWGMTPQTVNAYSNPEMNEVVFPAAILQPPFFDANADDAVNYGGIGAVIGHEISHGFDDQGSQYDGDGNLKSWWTDEDMKKFQAKIDALAAQYDRYEPIKSYHVNGRFTLSENIADLSGLTIAHQAYQLSLKGKPAPVIDGLTGDQRFFMGWAQVWRRKYRDENLLTRLKTDPHSPSEYRADGVVTNMPSFYEAFSVKPTDKLYTPAEQRITIW